MEARTIFLFAVMMPWMIGSGVPAAMGQEPSSLLGRGPDLDGALSILVRRLVDAAPMLWDDALSLNLATRDGTPEERSVLADLERRLEREGFSVVSSFRSPSTGVRRLELSVSALDRWQRKVTLKPLDAALAAPSLAESYWVSPFRTPLAPAEILAMGEPKKSKKSAVRDARRAAQKEWERRSRGGQATRVSLEHFPSEVLIESVGEKEYVAFVRVRVPVDAASLSCERRARDAVALPEAARKGRRSGILPLGLLLGGSFLLYRYLDMKTHGWHTGLLRCAFGMIFLLGACRLLGCMPW